MFGYLPRAAAAIALAALIGVAAAAAPDADEYAGSGACEGCHTYIYNSWITTRHSYSVRTAAEAREAGYPLPRRRSGGDDPDLLDWPDLSYVIGGRQRIAYVDRSGRVLDTSFHHRLGGWDVFPSLEMPVCATCHYTGVGAGDPHPENPALPGRWAERNIGCEACHGAGARHVETLEKSDIVKSPSSRVCGQCHTEVGKILPKGELHATHDLLQVWNQDPHVTGVRRHSHNAFCSSCHSPYDGHTNASVLQAERRVFTEQKQNITCIGCHDPHALTHPQHRRDLVSLDPPVTIRSHSFEGDDADFTTTDHREWGSAAESCLACHRGADRVDLDHANASCVDCHNTFNRNHSPESRQFHDSNQPRLSCLGCHDDADYLMSIVYGDPDFLDPRNIHNLRKLPEIVRQRYGLRYGDLRAPGSVVKTAAAGEDTDPAPAAAEAADKEPPQNKSLDALRELLESESQARFAAHATIRPLHDAILEAPGSPAAHIALAQAYADLGEAAPAREILARAASLDSSRLLLELPLAGADALADADGDQTTADAAARLAGLLPDSPAPADTALNTWLLGHLHMMAGDFDAARQTMASAAGNATTGLYRGLAEFGAGRLRQAQKLFEANLRNFPSHHASAAALGMVQMMRQRAAPAAASLEHAVSLAPAEGSAHLLLGQARIAAGELDGAVKAFARAIEVEPGLHAARFLLAHAYQSGGRFDAAIGVYETIIEREPDLFEARYALANVLKLLSDQVSFQLRAERESNPPAEARPANWRARHALLQQQIDEFRNRALSELAVARRLRPGASDTIHQIAEIYRASNRLHEARRFFETLRRHEPENWLYRYRLGTVSFALGDYASAIDELQTVIDMAPTDGDSYLALGLALIRASRLDEAIDVFERATTYEPFNPGLYTNLGAAYADRGDFSKAQAAFERSLQLHSFPLPRVHLTHTNLALVFLRSGRTEDAVFALRRALHRYRDYPLARELLERATRGAPDTGQWPGFVYNEWLERFGEVTTVAFSGE